MKKQDLIKTLKDLEKIIKKEFGKKCDCWAFGCSVCGAYQSLDTLKELFDIEENK